jgi:hypothetical protein
MCIRSFLCTFLGTPALFFVFTPPGLLFGSYFWVPLIFLTVSLLGCGTLLYLLKRCGRCAYIFSPPSSYFPCRLRSRISSRAAALLFLPGHRRWPVDLPPRRPSARHASSPRAAQARAGRAPPAPAPAARPQLAACPSPRCGLRPPPPELASPLSLPRQLAA